MSDTNTRYAALCREVHSLGHGQETEPSIFPGGVAGCVREPHGYTVWIRLIDETTGRPVVYRESEQAFPTADEACGALGAL